MGTIRIIVEGDDVKVGTREGLLAWLESKRVRCLIDIDGDEVVDFAVLVDGGEYTLGEFTQPAPQQQQQQQQQQPWFKVSGAISQLDSHAGARYQLYKLASAHSGLYPPGGRGAIAVTVDGELPRSVIKFAVVFRELGQAVQFINGITMYLATNKDRLILLSDEWSVVAEPTTTPISSYQVTPSDFILQAHYKPQDGEADPASPPFDVVFEVGSSSATSDVTRATSDVTLLSISDPILLFQRIENDNSFVLAEPESAHIFPSAKCQGIYEWLDAPEFNRLALSRDVHLNFDGTARGRGKRRKTQQTFAIRPLRPENGYATSTVANICCYKIPLELVLNVNELADALISKLGNNATLHRHDGSRWTIDGSDVTVHCPHRRVTLRTEETDNDTLSLVTGIPGVKDLNDCWSNSATDLYSVEAAEIMEKCLLWNYQNALESWSRAG